MFGLDPSSETNIAVLWQFKLKGGREKILFCLCSVPFLSDRGKKKGCLDEVGIMQNMCDCNKLQISIIDQFWITHSAQ